MKASRRSQRLQAPSEETLVANFDTNAGLEPLQQHPDTLSAAIGLDWGDNLSLMMDAGFGEASQMWLWADDTSFDAPL